MAAGADRRLDGRPFPVRDVHGPDGLAGLGPSGLVAGLVRHQAARGAGLGDAAVMLRLAEPDLPPDEWAGRVASLCHERPLQ